MRTKYIFLLIAIASVFTKLPGQVIYTANTYYVIIPTSGCNGVWAFNAPISTNCNPPYLIEMTPFGCATYNHITVDTLFYDLCSIPCNYYLISSQADTCAVCGVNFLTSAGNNVANYEYKQTSSISPNPFTNKATLQFDNPTKDNCTLTVYNIQGQVVQTITNITKEKVEIERQNLVSGLYYFQLQTDKLVVATGKLMIE